MSTSEYLTHRQVEVLQLLARGRNTEQIANELSITALNAQTDIRNAMKTLGARSRAEAVNIARRARLIR